MADLLPALGALACPVGMGVMMVMMSRGSRRGEQPAQPPSVEVVREEHRRLGAEIERLEQLTAGALAAAAVAGCGGGGERTTVAPAGAPTPSRYGPQHIHGLGVRGGTLYIATHTGLWTAPAGETKARRVGASRQDIMGFSVVAPDRFLGSGHPAPGQTLPPNLGLIESRDGGRTWQSISLLGDADFHVLQSAGRRVYGFDVSHARLLVSSDEGRSWSRRTPPAGVFGLAIEPGRPREIVASTERGLFVSPDAGRRWRPLRADLGGLLSWPARERLYMIDGSGSVRLSTDRGRSWRSRGTIAGEPAAFIAHGQELYAALGDATVKRSTDGGRTWQVRARP